MSRLTRRPRVNHAKAAATLRAKPGEWLPIGEYRSRTSADGIAWMIRAAPDHESGLCYAPAGSFEARTELTDDGTRVIARYIGCEQPNQEQIKVRMRARRTARLNAEPTKYHATTAWADDGSGESADPYCADCKTPVCHRWARIQLRLDQQRFGLPRRVRRARKTPAGGWGGDQPWPF